MKHTESSPPPRERRGEAVRIYRALFASEPPAGIVERFNAASERLESVTERRDVDTYHRALDRALDLEALEVAARYRGRLPLLSAKFRLMVYMAETVPANQHHFVNRRRRRAAGYVALFGGALRTGFKLAVGLVELARFRDA